MSVKKLKQQYLDKAIAEYEYSWAPEYEKKTMTQRATRKGTLDFEYDDADRDVDVTPNGAWVKCRVWIPKRRWLSGTYTL